VKVVVFESAVDGFFLNHSDFLAKFEDLTSIPQGPTGLEESERAGTPAWPPSTDQRRRKESKPSWSKGSRSQETRKIDSDSTWDSWASTASAEIRTAYLTC
jgi:hypothetical protein